MKYEVCSTPSEGCDKIEASIDDRESIHGGAFRDLSGMRFGKWTVEEWVRTDAHGSVYKCRCECGTEREVRGAALTNGSSRSCGAAGCRNRTTIAGSKMPTNLLVAPEDMQAYRIWCDLIEIADPRNWRCQANGRPYPVRAISLEVKDWPTFQKWMNGEVIDQTEGSRKNLTERQTYYKGMVLVSREGAPTFNMDDGVSKGIFARFEDMEWMSSLQAQREGRVLILGNNKTKYYRVEGESRVYTRKQLTERFGVTMSTFNARISRGWTTSEACVGKRDFVFTSSGRR